MAVTLPEGTYRANAVLMTRDLDRGPPEPIVRITMAPGHAIPVGGPVQTITHYIARTSTFNEALEALERFILAVRALYAFTAPAFEEGSETAYPAPDAPGWRMVLVRRRDGSPVHVPAGTTVVPLTEQSANVLTEPIEMLDFTHKLFRLKARAIEELVGRWVLVAPSFGASILGVMFVEGLMLGG